MKTVYGPLTRQVFRRAAPPPYLDPTLENLRSESIFWLDFENVGNVSLDKSGKGNNAIMVGTPTYGSDANGKYWQGATNPLNAGIVFNGKKDLSSFTFLFAVSISAFTGADRFLFDAGYYTPSIYGPMVTMDQGANNLNIIVKNMAGSTGSHGSIPFTPDTMIVLGCVWGGNSFQTWKNGEKLSTPKAIVGPVRRGTQHTARSGYIALNILRTMANTGSDTKFYFAGWWDRALSDYEMKRMYNFIASGEKKNQSCDVLQSNVTSCYATNDQAAMLWTPTPDGTGQAVHPSVAYFPDGWAGYEFWMAMTPYYKGNDDLENPCLLASHDGIVWIVPDGVTNPISPGLEAPYFNADVELVYEPELDQMRLFWSENGDPPRKCYKIISSDLSMSEIQTIPWDVMGFVRNSALDWIYWKGDCGRLHSSDGGATFVNDGPMTLNTDGVWEPWHVSVYKENENLYHFLVAMYPVGTGNSHTQLFYGYITDPNAMSITNLRLFMPPGTGWTSGQIYRSCMIKIDSVYRVYISARDAANNWYIGFKEVNAF